jgi:hypothetical protein
MCSTVQSLLYVDLLTPVMSTSVHMSRVTNSTVLGGDRNVNIDKFFQFWNF